MLQISRNLQAILKVTKKFCSPWWREIMNANQGSRKAFLLVVLVFALGIALGAVGTYVVTTRVLAARPQLNTVPNRVALFTRDLDLTPEQRPKFEDMLRRFDKERRNRQNEAHD